MPFALDRNRIRTNIRSLQRTSLSTRAVEDDIASRPSSRTSGILTDTEEPSPDSDFSSAQHPRGGSSNKAHKARRGARDPSLPGVVVLCFEDSRHRYPVLATSLATLCDAVKSVMVETGRLKKTDPRVAVPITVDGPVDDVRIESEDVLVDFLAGPHAALLPMVTAVVEDPRPKEAEQKKKEEPTKVEREEQAEEDEATPPPTPPRAKKAAPPPSPPREVPPTSVETAVSTEPAPTTTTACGSSRSVSPDEDDYSDALWHGIFTHPNAAKATIADLRMEAIDGYFATRSQTIPRGPAASCDADGSPMTPPPERSTEIGDLEITLRNATTGKPLLLSRDVRRAAAATSDAALEIEAFIYRAPVSATPSPVHTAAAVDVTPQSPAPDDDDDDVTAPPPPEDVEPLEPVSDGDNEDEPKEEEEEAEPETPPKPVIRKKAAPPGPGRQPSGRPLIGLRGGAASPPENARAAGRASVRIPITYDGTNSVVAVPVSRQPSLADLVADAVGCFEAHHLVPELVPRATLSYVRAGVGVNARPTLVDMTDDAHVAGLVWEALERDRQGDDLKEMELALSVRRPGRRA